MDMLMLSMCNSRERDASDWREVFQDADPRFKVQTMFIPKGSVLGIVEVLWQSEV